MRQAPTTQTQILTTTTNNNDHNNNNNTKYTSTNSDNKGIRKGRSDQQIT